MINNITQQMTKWFSILLLATAAFSITNAQAAPSPRDMFMENVSPLTFDATVEALKTEIAANGWSVLAIHNLSATLAKSGHNILPITTIEACSGKFSVPLLRNDSTRYVSSLLPCRVSVYQTSDGKVIISRVNVATMATQMEPAVSEIMLKASASFEPIIDKVLAKQPAL
ncbi:MAG: DUF302 domain-containing protein [Sulfuriferula sp.]|nr:DUF302 domain-containing protein [Sulfuriferula sp.]